MAKRWWGGRFRWLSRLRPQRLRLPREVLINAMAKLLHGMLDLLGERRGLGDGLNGAALLFANVRCFHPQATSRKASISTMAPSAKASARSSRR